MWPTLFFIFRAGQFVCIPAPFSDIGRCRPSNSFYDSHADDRQASSHNHRPTLGPSHHRCLDTISCTDSHSTGDCFKKADQHRLLYHTTNHSLFSQPYHILPGLLCTGSNMAFDDELLELHFDNIDSHQTGGDCRHILP